MSKLFNVRVRPDYRYSIAQVSGRIFSKRGQVFAESYLDDEIRDSPLLEVKLQRAPRKPKPPEEEDL